MWRAEWSAATDIALSGKACLLGHRKMGEWEACRGREQDIAVKKPGTLSMRDVQEEQGAQGLEETAGEGQFPQRNVTLAEQRLRNYCGLYKALGFGTGIMILPRA